VAFEGGGLNLFAGNDAHKGKAIYIWISQKARPTLEVIVVGF